MKDKLVICKNNLWKYCFNFLYIANLIINTANLISYYKYIWKKDLYDDFERFLYLMKEKEYWLICFEHD